MKKIVKIGAMSLGKILGVIYAVMGLVFGGLITLASFFASSLLGGQNNELSIFFGVGSIIILPLMYGVAGLIFGLLIGWTFNLSSRLTGGLAVEIQEPGPEDASA
jgi:hypothetical protein